jgi:hypothetical protein
VLDDLQNPQTSQTSTFHLLHPDYDILQAIRSLLKTLPVKADIFHVKSHQDRDKPYDELTPFAQINVLADHHAETIHSMPTHLTGLFPTWVHGTKAALFHGTQQVTKDIPTYVRTASHAPAMREYLIKRSQTATGRDSQWNDSTFDSIAWQPLGEAFTKLSIGQRTQLSKYMNDLLPTLRRQQTFDNTVDGRCFDCGLLWEDTNHVLRCHSDSRDTARATALRTFRAHLQRQHTPDIMATLLCNSMARWLQRECISPQIGPCRMNPSCTNCRPPLNNSAELGGINSFEVASP